MYTYLAATSVMRQSHTEQDSRHLLCTKAARIEGRKSSEGFHLRSTASQVPSYQPGVGAEDLPADSPDA